MTEEQREDNRINALPPAERVPARNRRDIVDLKAGIKRIVWGAPELKNIADKVRELEEILLVQTGGNQKPTSWRLDKLETQIKDLRTRTEEIKDQVKEERVEIKVVPHWTDIFRRR